MSTYVFVRTSYGIIFPGQILFETAINGFLSELFDRWRACGSSHEVTIVLFSRCFYKAKSKEDFPQRMRDCLQIGPNGDIYEDFYSVVVQVSHLLLV